VQYSHRALAHETLRSFSNSELIKELIERLSIKAEDKILVVKAVHQALRDWPQAQIRVRSLLDGNEHP
jgi:hypothetical protein